MPWSYQEDMILLSGSTQKLNRSMQAINVRRRMLERTTSIEQLIKEELFIKNNYSELSVLQMAESLNSSSITISRRIKAMKREGKLTEDKPKIINSKQLEIKPMEKKMTVPYSAAPKNALNKSKIQEDKLELNKEYLISRAVKKGRIKKVKMKLIGCYLNHYLFVTDKGIKHSLSKVNLAIGEWKYEEI